MGRSLSYGKYGFVKLDRQACPTPGVLGYLPIPAGLATRDLALASRASVSILVRGGVTRALGG